MNILITGGSGFLGSHVADALEHEGHMVTIFDQNLTDYPSENQKIIQGDISDTKALEEALEGQEVVYHFAAISDLDDCIDKPSESAYYNVYATVNMVQICLRKGIKRFIYGSTVYVYSDSGSFYRASKQSSEIFLDIFSKENGLELTTLRYGSLYGPRAGRNNSIYKILKEALSTGKVTYHGSGSERREFVHVYDAANASVQALNRKYIGECLTITGADIFKYSELLEMISEIFPNPLDLIYEKNTSQAHYNMTPYRYIPKSGKKFIVNPSVDMGQGILEYLHLLKSQI
jgi:UDP-glucose 4-epimerase